LRAVLDELCEGVHGEDWEWEAEGDGGQVQGSEAVEREKKILIIIIK